MITLAEYKKKLADLGDVRWTSAPPVEFFWCFEMKAARGEIWKYISDTSRFNREMGFAKRDQREEEGQLLVSTSMMGLPQKWIEEPWTWTYGRTITSTRQYITGLVKSVHSVFHIDDQKFTDKRLVYVYFGWYTEKIYWAWFLKAMHSLMRKKFGATFAKIDAHLAQALGDSERNALIAAPPIYNEGALRKLKEIREKLHLKNLKPLTVDLLCDHVMQEDELELESLKLIPLAKKWKLELNELLVTCLHSVRLGLLQLSWEVICPHCRGSRFTADSLGDIPSVSECTICKIDFATDQAESIEVVFHVNPAIRQIESLRFCAAEPSKKNHIKVQQKILAGESLILRPFLNEGLHRARLVGGAAEQKLQVVQNQLNEEITVFQNDDVVHLGPQPCLQIKNDSSEPQLFVLEELAWENSALKPADLLSLPEFRDLFAEEHLSSNVKLYLGSQTILFTDIVGSTKFYDEVGDAKAFADVRKHYQEVFEIVRAHGGVVVKTIGDSVMASFTSSLTALESAIAMQQCFHRDRTDTKIRLRISLHSGPVIAVHLNTGIDYFGSTVNFAAKIQSRADACEIAMSEQVHQNYLGSKSSWDYKIEARAHKRESNPVDVFVMSVTPELNSELKSDALRGDLRPNKAA